MKQIVENLYRYLFELTKMPHLKRIYFQENVISFTKIISQL